ncbi:uncharacterized protein PG986_002106 [Apiospora aurea]|uniref:Uncharacterized protein n=1 Tax=Apiospora aurea TaxID=335848 RepID=A0ABR1QYX2_9PEZI
MPPLQPIPIPHPPRDAHQTPQTHGAQDADPGRPRSYDARRHGGGPRGHAAVRPVVRLELVAVLQQAPAPVLPLDLAAAPHAAGEAEGDEGAGEGAEGGCAGGAEEAGLETCWGWVGDGGRGGGGGGKDERQGRTCRTP